MKSCFIRKNNVESVHGIVYNRLDIWIGRIETIILVDLNNNPRQIYRGLKERKDLKYG